MVRVLTVGYGVLCYLVFLVVFGYLVGFLGGFPVPRTVDDGIGAPLGQAIAVNLVLIGLFAAQHTIMARPAFKRWWTRFAPAAVERSTYVLASSLLLALLFWQWRTIADIVWDVTWGPGRIALQALFWAGWLIVLGSTFMIDHFDLFGLRQVYLAWRQRAYSHVPFRTTMFYRFVRHPIMAGFIIAFWATPTMTVGHLLFAAATTGYILVGVRVEERDLVAALGNSYRDYQRRVPRLIPGTHGGPSGGGRETVVRGTTPGHV